MVRRSSVRIAKDRLKVLVGTDRMQCKPDFYEKISRELYQTLSKYIEINLAGIDGHCDRFLSQFGTRRGGSG